jgi:iron(III) transport system substrate-binding protein
MTRFSRSLVAALAAVASLGLASCGDDDAQTGSADGAAKELTVYSGRDEELVAPLFKRFEAESGIKLKVRYADTAELAATIREEGKNSPADVFFGQDAGALGALQKSALLTTLPAATLELVEPRYRSKQGAWVGTSARARVIAYDTRKLKESDLPASTQDLTDAKWKGKVGWAPTNASFQAFVTAMRKLDGDAATEQWLKAMKANGTKAYEKNGLVRDAIAGGEVELGLINHYYVLEAAAKAEGDYPVGVHFVPGGDVGALVNVAGGGVLKSSEHAAQGVQLLNFLLNDASQKYIAETTFEYPLAGNTPAPAGIPSLAEIQQPDLDLSDLDDLQGTLALIEKAGVL